MSSPRFYQHPNVYFFEGPARPEEPEPPSPHYDPKDYPLIAPDEGIAPPEKVSIARKALTGTARFLAGDFPFQKHPAVKWGWRGTTAALSYPFLFPAIGTATSELADRLALSPVMAAPGVSLGATAGAVIGGPVGAAIGAGVGAAADFAGDAPFWWNYYRTPKDKRDKFVEAWRSISDNGTVPTDAAYYYDPIIAGAKNVIKKPDFDYYKKTFSRLGTPSLLDLALREGPLENTWRVATRGIDPKEHPYLFGLLTRLPASILALYGDMKTFGKYSPKYFALTAQGLQRLKAPKEAIKNARFFTQALNKDRALFQLNIPFKSEPIIAYAPGFFKPFSRFGRTLDAFKTVEAFKAMYGPNARSSGADLIAHSDLRKLFRLRDNVEFSRFVRGYGKMSFFFDKLFSRRPPGLEAALMMSESGGDPVAWHRGLDPVTRKAGPRFNIAEQVLGPEAYERITGFGSKGDKILNVLNRGDANILINPSDRKQELFTHWLKAMEPYFEEYSKTTGAPLLKFYLPASARSLSTGDAIKKIAVNAPRDFYPFLSNFTHLKQGLPENASRVARVANAAYNWLINTFLVPATTIRNIISQQFQLLASNERIDYPALFSDMYRGYVWFLASRFKNRRIRHAFHKLLSKAPDRDFIMAQLLGGKNGFFTLFPSARTSNAPWWDKYFLNLIPNINNRVSEASEAAVRGAFYLQLLKNGYKGISAGLKTAKTLINYTGLHPLQRYLRYVFPFATFTIGNVKNNLHYLSNNPLAILAPRVVANTVRPFHGRTWPAHDLPNLAYESDYSYTLPLYKNKGIDLSGIVPSSSTFGVVPAEISSRFASPYINLALPFLDIAFPHAGFLTPDDDIYYQQRFGPLFGLNWFNRVLGPRGSDRLTAAFVRNLPLYGVAHNLIYSYNPANNVFYGTHRPSFANVLARSVALQNLPTTYSWYRQQLRHVNQLLRSSDLAESFTGRLRNRFYDFLTGGEFSKIRERQLLSAKNSLETFLDADPTANPSKVKVPAAFRLKGPTGKAKNNPWSSGLFKEKFRKYLFTRKGRPYDGREYGNIFHEAVQGNKNIPYYLTSEGTNYVANSRKLLGIEDRLTQKTQFMELPVVLKRRGLTLAAGRADVVMHKRDPETGLLHLDLIDLKFGSKEVSPPIDNGQLIIYALALLDDYPEVDYVNVLLYQPVPGIGGWGWEPICRSMIPELERRIKLLPLSFYPQGSYDANLYNYPNSETLYDKKLKSMAHKADGTVEDLNVLRNTLRDFINDNPSGFIFE